MARKRMIDPGIWIDEGFLSLSIPARLLWIGMISGADDEGRGLATDRCLKAKVFPSDDVTVVQVKAYRDELCGTVNVSFYDVGGREYYQLTKWGDHQKVEHPTASTIPQPLFTEGSPKTPRAIAPNELTNQLINELISKVVSYLNQKTCRAYSAKSKAAISHISARAKEGRTFDEFKRVIDSKVSKWGKDEKMCDYLRPETLFGTKFDSYLAGCQSVKAQSDEYPACPECGKPTTSRCSGAGGGKYIYKCSCGGEVVA